VKEEEHHGMIEKPTKLPTIAEPGASYLDRVREIVENMWFLGLVAFGGSQAHLVILEGLFVFNKQWMTRPIFAMLSRLSASVPGAASTHMIFAISSLRGGWLCGFLAIILFYLPGFILMTVFGLLVSTFNNTLFVLDIQHALGASAVGIFALTLSRIASKLLISRTTEAIACLSACLSIFVPDMMRKSLGEESTIVWIYPLILGIGALTTMIEDKFTNPILPLHNPEPSPEKVVEMKQVDEGDQAEIIPSNDDIKTDEIEMERQMQKAYRPLESNIGYFFLFLSFLLFLSSVFILILVQNFGLAHWYSLFDVVGFFVFAHPQAMIPFFVSDIVSHSPYHDTTTILSTTDPWSTQRDFERDLVMGLAIMQAMPGPMFNLSAYLGALLAGIPGAICCWLGLLLPGVFIMAGVIPFWKTYLDATRVAIRGINAAIVGLITAALIHLWNVAVGENVIKIILALLSFLFAYWRVPSPLIAIMSALFGIAYFIVGPNES
jgi:chromate transporter